MTPSSHQKAEVDVKSFVTKVTQLLRPTVTKRLVKSTKKLERYLVANESKQVGKQFS